MDSSYAMEEKTEFSNIDIANKLTQVIAYIESELPCILNKEEMKRKIVDLQSFLRHQRPPRLIIIGQAGCGKSSLLNALAGQYLAPVGGTKPTADAKSAVYRCFPTGESGSLEVLNTTGLFDKKKKQKGIRKLIQEELKKKPADIILYVEQISEVRNDTNCSLEELQWVLKLVKKYGSHVKRVIPVMTHCSEVSPSSTSLSTPATSKLEESLRKRKEENINELKNEWKKRIKTFSHSSINHPIEEIIAVNSEIVWKESSSIGDMCIGTGDGKDAAHFDNRWNIDELLKKIFHHLSTETHMIWASTGYLNEIKKRVAWTITGIFAGVCGIVGAIPIPYAELPILISLQCYLVIKIARIFRQSVTWGSALKFIGVSAGVGLALSHATRELVMLILPGYGSVISSAIATVVTIVLGSAAIDYFIDGYSKESD